MGFWEQAERLFKSNEISSESFLQETIDSTMERGYIDMLSIRDRFLSPKSAKGRQIDWVRLDRLPVNPSDHQRYDLFSRWQSVLASLHTWNKKTLFLLKREGGESHIFIGIVSSRVRSDVNRLESALKNCMPGIMFSSLSREQCDVLREDMLLYEKVGTVTGIPSFRRKRDFNVLQTLDQLAFGVHDPCGQDVNFSLLVVANPLTDQETTDIINRMRRLGSEIHSSVSVREGQQSGLTGLVGFINPLVSCIPIPGGAIAQKLVGSIATGIMANLSKSENRESLDKIAQYAERVTDMHVARLYEGRNLGFWNAGVYVMAQTNNDVMTVLGMLRALYSGDESYLEPIRVNLLKGNAIDIARRFELIPILGPWSPDASSFTGEEEETPWHVFGRAYQYISTPINTDELSLVTSLPRKDVPGLRFVKNAVRFANNPGDVAGEDIFSIGNIKDTGIVQESKYVMSVDSLVRHTLITGGTGCGKTTTCKRILNEVSAHDVPILIVEPAKDEWVQWAIAQRRSGRDVSIFMPGCREIYGERTSPLKLNPFAPAGIPEASVDALLRCERFTSIVNASLPVSDVLPVLIDESFFQYLKNEIGDSFTKGDIEQRDEWPLLEDVLPLARRILAERGYDERVQMGLRAALETRFAFLTRGKRGEVLNVRRCTPWNDLFEKTCVVNLSRMGNAGDRALIMSVLLMALHEYRVSRYMNDDDYRRSQHQANRLRHLTVVEEAHNVLRKPDNSTSSAGDAKRVVADMFGDMLSEIRSYGEGLMILDQVPTRLIPDVIKNTNYKIAHRMASPDDCSVMEAALALRDDQRGILPTLAQGEAVVLGDHDDAASWVKIKEV